MKKRNKKTLKNNNKIIFEEWHQFHLSRCNTKTKTVSNIRRHQLQLEGNENKIALLKLQSIYKTILKAFATCIPTQAKLRKSN